MKRPVIFLILLTLTFWIPAAVFANDVIQLEDGTVLEGQILAQNQDGTRLLIGFGNKREPEWVSLSDIKSIRFDHVPVSSVTTT